MALFRKLIKSVTDANIQYDILEMAVEMAMSDADFTPSEHQIIKLVCSEWQINVYAFD